MRSSTPSPSSSLYPPVTTAYGAAGLARGREILPKCHPIRFENGAPRGQRQSISGEKYQLGIGALELRQPSGIAIRMDRNPR